MNSTTSVIRLFVTIWKTKSKGRRNELRAVAAFDGSFYDVPPWFRSIRNASPVEDGAGIDVVVYTDVGRIKVQIKSCRKKADGFKQDQEKGRYAKDILVVALLEDYTPWDVRHVILLEVEPAYQGMVAKLAKDHGVRFIPAPLEQHSP